MRVMYCALGRPFYGDVKMTVALARNAPQSNLGRIKVGFLLRHKKSSKTKGRVLPQKEVS